MIGFARAGLIALTLVGVAAVQEKKQIQTYVQNSEEGVEIRAPQSSGKDQMWEAYVKESGFWKDSAVLVKHRVDLFTVEVNVQRKEGKNPMSEAWNKPVEIAKNSREHLTKKDGDKEPNFTACKVVSEDPKAKLAGLPGPSHQHRILLTDKNGGSTELIEYFVISSDVLYKVTIKFNKESFAKYWAKEGQFILNSIKRCKMDKKK